MTDEQAQTLRSLENHLTVHGFHITSIPVSYSPNAPAHVLISHPTLNAVRFDRLILADGTLV